MNSFHPVKLTFHRVLIPIAQHVIEAGFPSPAEGLMDEALDLNELLIEHPNATYFVRVRGDSMRGAGITHGDLLIVDRARDPRSGDVVIAALNGSFTVKRWRPISPQHAELVAEHPHYSPIKVTPEDDFMIWGVVCYVIHRP